jgi:hypothetical protein
VGRLLVCSQLAGGRGRTRVSAHIGSRPATARSTSVTTAASSCFGNPCRVVRGRRAERCATMPREHEARNCSCGDPECAAASQALDIEITNGPDQSWVETWGAGDYRTADWFKKMGMREWMLKRPPAIKDMMRKYPPDCAIRALPEQHLRVPRCGGYRRLRL